MFHQDRRITTREFASASGAFLWRFLLLALCSPLVPLVFLGSLYPWLDQFSEYLGDKVAAEQVGVCIQIVGAIMLALLLLLVRLWFDLAKVRAVARDKRNMWLNMWKSGSLTWSNLRSLFWIYFRISLVACIVLLIGFLIWIGLPATATPVTFVLLELILLAQLAARLWQLASITEWYIAYAEPVLAEPTSTLSQNTAWLSADLIAPAPSAEPVPAAQPDLEFPPADA